MEPQLLFKVIEGQKEYLIFSNGKVEGFKSDAIVVNYLGCLLATEVLEHECRRPS